MLELQSNTIYIWNCPKYTLLSTQFINNFNFIFIGAPWLNRKVIWCLKGNCNSHYTKGAFGDWYRIWTYDHQVNSLELYLWANQSYLLAESNGIEPLQLYVDSCLANRYINLSVNFPRVVVYGSLYQPACSSVSYQ